MTPKWKLGALFLPLAVASLWPASSNQHIHLENNILFPRAVEMEGTSAPDFYKSAGEFNEHRRFGH
jgi:hypothetical protein